MKLRKNGAEPVCLRILILWLFLLLSCGEKEIRLDSLVPPRAKKDPKALSIHGDTRIDPYFWLRERDNPEVIATLEAENAYCDSAMAHTEKLQSTLYREMTGRIRQDDSSVPYGYRGYYYYSRFEKGGEYPIYARKKGSPQGREEVMLHVPEMAKGREFFQVTGLSVSPDNRILAFGVDTLSRRKYTIRFKDLETGRMLPDEMPNTEGQAVWANDGKTVFYTVKDSTLRPFIVMRHILGKDPKADAEVYRETDNTFSTGIRKSRSEKYLLIESTSTLSSEVRFLDADEPGGIFRVVQPREKDHEYSVDHHGDRFLILTNWQAKNFRLMEAPVDSCGKKFWKERIPHREEVFLEGIDIFRKYLVLTERKNGLRQIRIIGLETGKDHYLDFGEEAYLAYPTSNYEFDTDLLRFAYSSLTTPNSVFDYHMGTQVKTLMKQDEVLGGFRQELYHAERIYAEAQDGVKIPVSLVYRKGFERDGSHPLLLYGYGSYGASMEASFNPVRLSLLDRGFVYAIAHVRGGGEMGRQWYEDGKLLKKKNTFTDFIACAEHLVEEKYTQPSRLFAQGGSAGGLLIGAVVNMRPDLFRAVIAAVPWVDVVSTMLDESIPLTTSEYDEWGNPNQKEYYDYMLSYSPYDQVESKDYPAMLVTTGLHDSQVQYWEPAKWVAKLRDMKTDHHLLLLHTQMHAGHGGASGRFQRYKENAFQYAFILSQLGENP